MYLFSMAMVITERCAGNLKNFHTVFSAFKHSSYNQEICLKPVLYGLDSI